jgi:hypothetical protein
MAVLAPALPFIAAASSLFSGLSQSSAMRSQAAAADYNASIAQQQAASIRTAGNLEIERKRREGQRLLGRQEALYNKAGVTMEGTPLDVMAETAADLEFDELIRKYNIEIGASRAESEARQYRFMGERSRGLAGSAIMGGALKAGTSLLTGLTKDLSPVSSPVSSMGSSISAKVW